MIVHALSAKAKAFYEQLGFDPSPLDPMTLMITLAGLRASLYTPAWHEGTRSILAKRATRRPLNSVSVSLHLNVLIMFRC